MYPTIKNGVPYLPLQFKLEKEETPLTTDYALLIEPTVFA